MTDFKQKTNWIPTIISIVIGILITVGATWYTIYLGRQELREAEKERLSKVKENLVAIVEEHIVNQDSLNLNSFERLISNRTREEGLITRPSIYDLLTQAEYNIESSKHLSFDKKNEYSKIIASLYGQLSSDTTIKFLDNRYQEEINIIINALKETKEKEGKQALANLIKHYKNEISSIQEANIDEDSVFEFLLQSPTRLILITLAYSFFIGTYWFYIIRRRRRREFIKRINKQLSIEKETIYKEIERLKHMMSNDNISSKERIHLEERLEIMYQRLMYLEEKYFRHHKLKL